MTLQPDYKGKIIHYSHHQVKSDKDFDFSADEYSMFKYGADNIAQKFGYQLAESFIENCLSKTYDGRPIVIIPSAHSYIPTASFFMKNHFKNKVNDFLYKNNYPIIEETKIHRTVTYREDYGEMSAEDRYKLISGDKFHVDKEFIGDKILLHLDDIKITGTHERIIIKMLNEYSITNDCYMLYYAELTNENISPKIENYLNNYFVKSLNEVDSIIKEQNFIFNTRVVKFILNARPDEFDKFILMQNRKFINDLYYNAIGNEYFKFSSYLRNLNELRKITT